MKVFADNNVNVLTKCIILKCQGNDNNVMFEALICKHENCPEKEKQLTTLELGGSWGIALRYKYVCVHFVCTES